MATSKHLRAWLALSASTAAILTAAPALAQSAGAPVATANAGNDNRVAELVVTAQRREEAIQSVPVAVSAFSANNLKAQRLDGAENLVLSVPNVTYSRSNFGGNNFQIRGIGTKVVSAGAESGVSFNENEVPVASNHLQDADFFDVERVEVLRGPQGTLFGRSATGGAINVVTAKPTDRPEASITGEYGNYNTVRVTGFINAPLGDIFSLRLAGYYLKRDGFGKNSVTGNKVDDRDLGAWRATLAFKPTDNFRGYLQFEQFKEDDSRNRVGKQLCIKDPGPSNVGGVPLSTIESGLLSQGCQTGSLYQSAAYGTVNSIGTLGGIYATELGLNAGDALAGHPLQNSNLHDIESAIDPRYVADQKFALLNLEWDITPQLTITSKTAWNDNRGYSTEDYNRLVASVPYGSTPAPGCLYCVLLGPTYTAFLYPTLFPGGVVNDPQLGATNRFRVFDRGVGSSEERTQELRLQSHFNGPLNFSAGAIYIKQDTSSDYFVFFNPLTALFQFADFPTTTTPFYIDPNGVPDRSGHNYYDAYYKNHLESTGYFGELYYKFNDDLKLTLGLRQTEDKKAQDNYAITLATPGKGVGALQTLKRDDTVTTGRVNIDWTPHLGFTNQTLVYGSYSRGYKAGGFNTPCQNADLSSGAGSCGYSQYYQPEYVDAFEIGTKNTLLNGSLVLNLTGFYYDYSGYQISTIVRKSSVNVNIDAEIYGAELESIWQPINHLTLNANLGYLHTKITNGSVLDQANLTQGDPNLIELKGSDGSNCVVNRAALTGLLAGLVGQPAGIQELALVGNSAVPGASGVCGGQYGNTGNPLAGLYSYGPNVQTAPQKTTVGAASYTVNVGQGIPVNLSGKELPNSPEFTAALGAQYVFELGNNWRATARADYYWQADSYARIFNAVNDKLKSWDNVNATLNFDNRDLKLNVQFYIKNAFDSQPFTDFYLTDASSGLFTNVFTLDPRTYGVSVTKRF